MVAAPVDDGDLAALLWQTVVGTWPIERERLCAYIQKAAREAHTLTSWSDPDIEAEQAIFAVIDAIYGSPRLRTSVEAFVTEITGYGWSNALGQKLVQLAMPGVPDTYQGTELWDNSLVDPDNRRAVDFDVRMDLLERLDTGWLPPVDASGAAKLLVTSRTLRLRRDAPELFCGYRPVPAAGPGAPHVLAFDRGGAIAVATRLPVALAHRGGWSPDDQLPVPDLSPGMSCRDAFTDRRFAGPVIEVGDLLDRYPVALLVRS